ncbi:hypothetical protein CPB84DRAFT_1711302 [Gymnopilus junonius]|uniref:BTB domain-containing protein n=1 Tax=Gymnopilus junonius TaxID=109634 RepID=A0A9P5NKE1_GYMJU|nr:hypothetical protein CPB84DRAFT_1711302 [Gymnopilus junonius]
MIHDLSSIVNADDADVTFQSSDNVLFHIHRRNLEAHTGAFPGKEFINDGETVCLTEPAEVLEIVFQFIYPKRYPRLKDLDFDIVADVAEAVEKYEIFSAMLTCEVRLREFLPEHATDIFLHAVKHDYPDLMNETALLLGRSPFCESLGRLPPQCVLPWIEYRAEWQAVFENAIQFIQRTMIHSNADCFDASSEPSKPRHFICSNCRPCLITWVMELERMGSVSLLKKALENPILSPYNPNHTWCHSCVGNHCKHVSRVVRMCQDAIDAIPPFTHFLWKKKSAAFVRVEKGASC